MNAKEQSDSENGSSSSDESVVWTAEDEKGFLRAYGALTDKDRDPKIYDGRTKFFEKGNVESARPSTSKGVKECATGPKMSLRDYEQKLVLERGGILSDEEDEGQDQIRLEESSTTPHFGQQELHLKEELKRALKAESSDSDGELLSKKVKSAEEQKQEDDDFYDWLKGEGSFPVADEHLKKLKARWASNNLDEGERFLRDYLCEKKHIVEEGKEDQHPSYDDITRDEEEEDRADQFEQKYNFRFEEPDQDFIKQFPRTTSESLRQQTDSKRREKRLRKKTKRAEKKETKKKLEFGDDDDDDEPKFKFRYRSVPANSFGLSTDEILEAEDEQLNAWAPIHKISAYRTDEEERQQIAYFQKKGMNTAKKQKIFKAAAEKSKAKQELDDKAQNPEPTTAEANGGQKKSKKKRRLKHKMPEIDADRLRSYQGASTKKMKRLLYNKGRDEKREQPE